MYLRRPFAQGGSPRRRLHRWTAASPATASPTARVSIPAASSSRPTSASDFDAYVQSECTDIILVYSEASPGPSPALPAVNCLHVGAAVPALAPTHAILNNLNSALWLPVLTCLQARGALTVGDCAGAARYLPAFTFRPLLPWLWTPTRALTRSINTSDDGAADAGEVSAAIRPAAARKLDEDDGADVSAEVYNNMTLVALELARRSSPVASTQPTHAISLADFSTAAPQAWAAMACALASSSLAATATRHDRRKLWHDVLFALRAHSAWDPGATDLRTGAHPQLLDVFCAFYADMRQHEAATDDKDEVTDTASVAAARAAAVAPPEVVVLTPPILLRNFRALYRQHRHSAMLFAELYAFCVEQEERSVKWGWSHSHEEEQQQQQQQVQELAGVGSTTPEARHASSLSTETRVPHLRTTSLLMDVDLALYFASLPGRRHSGLASAADQWTHTLRHLSFLLPRVHLLQRCHAAQQGPSTPLETLWQPWRRVAAVLMNVCVWVENDNREAHRCGEALRCTVEAVQQLSSSASTDSEEGGGTVVHTALGAPTAQETAMFISTLMKAASDCMRGKAAQLHYGPTDGLFGVSLLSVAVFAMLPSTTSKTNTSTSGVTDRRSEAKDNCIGTTAAIATDLLDRLRMFTHASKPTPSRVWAALRRIPAIRSAARYGLVTEGYRIFRECVVPQAAHASTASTARRLVMCLCAWAGEVGRPLGLEGRQVYALWQLRWAQAQQQQQHEGEETAAAASVTSSVTTTALQRLLPTRRGSRRRSQVEPRGSTWACGCGFHNLSISEDNGMAGRVMYVEASTSCVACVLRDLVPHSWECPSCHTVANSGVPVPYCLHCGTAHPFYHQAHHRQQQQEGLSSTCSPACGNMTSSVGQPHAGVVELMADTTRALSVEVPPPRQTVTSCWDCGQDCGAAEMPHAPWSHCSTRERNVVGEEEEEDEEATLHGLIYVCGACHTVTTAAPAPHAPSRDAHVEHDSAERVSCGACGSQEEGYYTAAFTWSCGCGGVNSALHDFCHVCSRAAQIPTLTCPQCRHVHTNVLAECCTHCSYPHPRRLAAVQRTRLVRCPACQGMMPPSSRSCPHCASTAVSAVAALLPTVADQPWLCVRCGMSHAVRDGQTGQLRTPSHLRHLAAMVLLPSHALTSSDARAALDETCCGHCGSRRIEAEAWEAGRLWSCHACDERYNVGAACRRCAVLAPGVPPTAVHVWRCAICGVYHPSWASACTTAGCGGSHDPTHSSRGGSATYCYAPWECSECGEVTLSSHVPACASCGAATPAAVWAVPCSCIACAKTAADARHDTHQRQGSAGSLSGAGVVADAVQPAPVSDTPAKAKIHSDDPSSRLAHVEAFLLQAADADTSQHAGLLDAGAVHTTGTGSLWPAVGATVQTAARMNTAVSRGRGERAQSALGGEEERWEEAYRTAVLSF